jgi:adenosylcobinamide-phosphate synthase
MSLLDALIAGAAPDRALILVAALVLDAGFGEACGPLRLIPHPVRLIGAVVAFLDVKLNRESRGARDRRARGALVVVLVSAGAAGLAWALASALRGVVFGWLLEVVLAASLLAQRSLYRHVERVAAALDRGGLEAGRGAVAHIVGRDVRRLDNHGVARAAIESCAENFSDGVVAPALFYLCFGLPGIAVYKAVNTMDSMIGHRSPRYAAFGWAAARLDDVLNLLPARLAAALITVAAVAVPTAQARAALRVALRDAGKHRSPNAGWPEAAMAGGLGLALAGPRRYGELVIDDPWIGDGTAQAGPRDIRRALALFVAASVALSLLVALGAVLFGG